MSNGEVSPPPMPQAPVGGPPPLPGHVPMKARWITWALVSVLLPGLPWLFAEDDKDGSIHFALLAIALLSQLAASIWVAVGLARNRGGSGGAAVGFSIVFMLASVAIGTAVWFVACIGFLSTQNWH